MPVNRETDLPTKYKAGVIKWIRNFKTTTLICFRFLFRVSINFSQMFAQKNNSTLCLYYTIHQDDNHHLIFPSQLCGKIFFKNFLSTTLFRRVLWKQSWKTKKRVPLGSRIYMHYHSANRIKVRSVHKHGFLLMFSTSPFFSCSQMLSVAAAATTEEGF